MLLHLQNYRTDTLVLSGLGQTARTLGNQGKKWVHRVTVPIGYSWVFINSAQVVFPANTQLGYKSSSNTNYMQSLAFISDQN